jgi:hypothetical protein
LVEEESMVDRFSVGQTVVEKESIQLAAMARIRTDISGNFLFEIIPHSVIISKR